MKKKSFYIYLFLLSIHAVIALVAFQHFWLHPHDVLFSDIGDGLKNIFTLTTYVKEPITSDGLFKYNSFQYPFGDYVYYTDNTPLFSIPFRWICHHIYDLSAHTIVILYVIVILNILLSGLLIYYILRNLVGENTISFIMAVILPWANMQILRIWVGHYAFSFTSLILLAICLMVLWHQHRLNRKKQAGIGIVMCLLCFFAFLAQGYYLAILTSFLSGMLFFYGFYYRKEKTGKVSMFASVFVAIASVSLSLSVLSMTDGYLSLRPVNATGYDWMEQKVRISGLFSRYNFQQFYFPVSMGEVSSESEKAGYLGNVGLFALFLLGIAMMANKHFRLFMIGVQKKIFNDPLKGSIFLGSLILLSISFGAHYYTADPHKNGFHLVNIFNPFFYIHLITKRVEQFRALERFIWPFFFSFNIWITYTIVAVYREYGKKVKLVILTGMLIFGGAELLDYIREMRHQTLKKNIFTNEYIENVSPKSIQFTRYQAILPIPFYSLGAENYDYNIIDNESWSNFTYRLAIKSRLPLMACKMSRTPLVYNLILMNFAAYDSLDNQLKAKLIDKPILVAVCKKLLNDMTGENIPREGNAAKLYANSLQFASRNHLQAIDSAEGVVYYDWYPPARK